MTLQFGDVMAEGYMTEVHKIMRVMYTLNAKPLFTLNPRSRGT